MSERFSYAFALLLHATNRLSLGLACLIGLAGCEPPPSENTARAIEEAGSPPAPDAQPGSARALLQSVADAYSKARTYEDTGELFVEATSEGRKQEYPPQDYLIAFERPNRLRVHAFNVSVVSDGKQISGVVPGIQQVLTLPSPPKLEIDNILGDKILSEALSGGMTAILPTLRLLLGDRNLPGFGPEDKLALLEDANLGDVACRRVEVSGPEGITVYWIDPKTHLLQRIEFATDEIVKKQNGAVDALRIWADFKNARINDTIAEKAFEFEAPANAQLVKRLLPPPPEAPSPLLGQQVGEFAFDNLSGEGTVDLVSIKGKIVVFDFWATWCGWCFRGLPNLQEVYDHFKDNDQVSIFAVDTDESSEDDDKVKKAFTDAKLHIPIARDRKEQNREVFGVEGLPTLIVLDGNGKVQHIHVGYDPNLKKSLTEVLDRLLKGDDVAKEQLEKHDAERSKYEQELNDVIIGTTSTIEVPQAQVANRTQPAKLKLTPIWTAEDVPLAGNLLVVDAAEGSSEIYVLSGSQNVVQLGPNGEVIEKYPLEIPRQVGVSSLRTASTAESERVFVAFANTQQQLFLFDQSWKRLLAYPDSQHAGLSDVQLADLDGNGQLEIVASYWGVVGVQAISLSGERLWSNRQLENVTRMAISAADDSGRRQVLCVNGRDFIEPIDAAGKAQAEIRVPQQALYALFAADLDSDASTEICALSSGELGNLTALGLDDKGEVLWNYPLPRGIHGQPVELVTPGSLPTSDGKAVGVWIIAGADGSIHFLAADGQLIDTFNYGEQLTGLATAHLGDRNTLIVGSNKSLTAWSVEPKE